MSQTEVIAALQYLVRHYLVSQASAVDEHADLHALAVVQKHIEQLTPGDPRVTTHHADCWQTRGHHACAIAKIEAMQKREATLVANLNDLSAQPDGCGYVVWLYEPEISRVVVPTIDAAIALLSPAPPTDGSEA